MKRIQTVITRCISFRTYFHEMNVLRKQQRYVLQGLIFYP